MSRRKIVHRERVIVEVPSQASKGKPVTFAVYKPVPSTRPPKRAFVLREAGPAGKAQDVATLSVRRPRAVRVFRKNRRGPNGTLRWLDGRERGDLKGRTIKHKASLSLTMLRQKRAADFAGTLSVTVTG